PSDHGGETDHDLGIHVATIRGVDFPVHPQRTPGFPFPDADRGIAPFAKGELPNASVSEKLAPGFLAHRLARIDGRPKIDQARAPARPRERSDYRHHADDARREYPDPQPLVFPRSLSNSACRESGKRER